MSENANVEFLFGVEKSSSGASWIAPKNYQENIKDLFIQELNISENLARLLVIRNYTINDAKDFLNPKIENLMPDPLTLIDMDKTIKRLTEAVNKKETIGVFGDYDVDGACSAAIISKFLRELGCKVEIHIPDRFTEGYGPNTSALIDLSDKGCTLILTLDCGITAFEPLKAASEKGIDIIIVDHHITGPTLPRALAIINPNRFDQEGDLGYLAAAGVCFLTVVALNCNLRSKGYFKSTDVPDLKMLLLSLLDLVALATICDVVPLKSLNRAFVSTGLQVMSRRGNPGLKALFDLSGVRESPDEQNLGFKIGPRINAAGRLGSSKLGVDLLCAEDDLKAEFLAKKLDDLNNKRREIQNKYLDEAIEIIEENKLYERDVIVVENPSWHEGVIGIMAGRIKDRYHKPVVVISLNDENIGKGSCRSVSNFDIGGAVIAAHQSEILIAGGGHAMAAGLTIEKENISKFNDFLEKRMKSSIHESKRLKDYFIEIIVTVSGANKQLVEDLRTLSPFGAHNMEPLIAIEKARVVSFRAIGKQANHFAFILKDGGPEKVDCIAFDAAGSAIGNAIKMASNGPLINIIGYLKNNNFNNKPQIQIKDCFLTE